MAATAWKNPKYEGGQDDVTFTANGAIVAGSFVEVFATGRVVRQAAAGSVKIVGVAHETVADGDQLTIDIRGSGLWVMKAKGNVTAGDPVGAASDGSAAVSTITVAAFGDPPKCVGIALDTIADGATGQVLVL